MSNDNKDELRHWFQRIRGFKVKHGRDLAKEREKRNRASSSGSLIGSPPASPREYLKRKEKKTFVEDEDSSITDDLVAKESTSIKGNAMDGSKMAIDVGAKTPVNHSTISVSSNHNGKEV